MKNRVFVVCFVATVLLCFGTAHAVPVMPRPPCLVNAEVENIRFVEAYFEGPNGMFCNEFGRNVSAHYVVTLKINSAQNFIPIGDEFCKGYKNYTVSDVVFDVEEGKHFEINQTVFGFLSRFGDECRNGYWLNSYEVIEPGTNSVIKLFRWQFFSYTNRIIGLTTYVFNSGARILVMMTN